MLDEGNYVGSLRSMQKITLRLFNGRNSGHV